jgi:hypothetical protein
LIEANQPDKESPKEITENILLKKIADLEKKDKEKDEQLKMLYAVADKGRLQNYTNARQSKKPFKVQLSVFDGKIIIGWNLKRDELIKDSRTGSTIGEKQIIEVKLLDKDGSESFVSFDGYITFSNARYDQRIEAEVINRKEDFQGNLVFDVLLPDGRTISLSSQFVN